MGSQLLSQRLRSLVDGTMIEGSFQVCTPTACIGAARNDMFTKADVLMKQQGDAMHR